jgi:hypothetical protein
VYVGGGTFTKQAGGIIYGSDAESGLRNTATTNGHAVYVYSSARKRDSTAGVGVTLDSRLHTTAGGWEGAPSPVSGITYSTVSGSGEWTLQDDGRRKSPAIGHLTTTKSRVSFTSTEANQLISIRLDVSSESGYDFAFVSTLDNASATYSNGYYTDSRISGTASVTVDISVPTAGSHFVDICYQKDLGTSSGSDCAWFKIE